MTMMSMMEIYLPCPRCEGRGKLPRGAALRAARREKKMTLKEMAERLGVSMSYLSDIEVERRDCTPKIARGYNL